LGSFIQELQRAIDFFNLQYSDQPVQEIIILGGLTGMKGILDLLVKELSLPVSVFQFSEQFEFINGNDNKEWQDKLPLAVGLALRGAKGWN